MRLCCLVFVFISMSVIAQSPDKNLEEAPPPPISRNDLVVRGLLKNMIVIEVRGKQHSLFAGKSSPEGFKLISSDTRGAVVEFEGERFEVGMSRQVGSTRAYEEPARKEVRIARGVGGHYFTPGRINNQPVDFLVDTGATSVVMNSLYADKLRINYKQGIPVRMQTASGVSQGYRVSLRSVTVGNVEINNVDAVVSEGAFPSQMLLGNSFLSRVEMKIDSGVLVLQALY